MVHEACPPHSSAGIVANMAASTVAQYLAALPADRRAALSAVRKAINENLPDGYEEGIQFGMHLQGSDERPRSHLPPFFRSVIHAGI
jgi:hypothetical protein